MTVLQYAPSLQEAGNLPSSLKRPVGLSACPGKDPHDPHRHPYPLQQALVGLSLLIRSERAGSSSASSLLQHLLPRDQDSAVEMLWLPSPESPCLLQELWPSWLIIPGSATFRGLLDRDNHTVGFSQTGEAC